MPFQGVEYLEFQFIQGHKVYFTRFINHALYHKELVFLFF